MVVLVILLCSLAWSQTIEPGSLLDVSIVQDYGNKVTCKRPSVKEMVNLWDAYPNKCVVYDKHNYLYVKTERFQIDRGTEIRLEFVKIWNHLLELDAFPDSWIPSNGTGLDDKGGTQEMFYNNIDCSYLMGEVDQLNQTLEILEKDFLKIKGTFRTYDFITKHIGALLSGFYLTDKPVFKEKAILYGERIFDFYEEWYPYTRYNFEKKKGEYGKIEMKELVNVGELYVLYKLTEDNRYKDLINRIVEGLKEFKHSELLPEYAFVSKNSLKYDGWLTSNSDSAEVQRLLWNNWRLSNREEKLFKTLYNINKKAILTLLPFTSEKGDVILIERTPKEVNYKMHLRMCGWAGILAEENKKQLNSSEIILAGKLMGTCLKVFQGLRASDYIHLGAEDVETKDGRFSLPGEIAESLFFLYRSTGEHWARKAGLSVFREIKEKYVKKFGFKLPGSEVMPRDVLSRTLKYLFLLQASHTLFLGAQFSPAGHLLGVK